MNMNAFARSSHHDHGDNDVNDRHGSSDDQQEEIILSSPGLQQQQLYLNHIHGGNP